MPTKKLSQIISEMPLDAKLVSLGGLITALSVFLPWYQDLDAFKTGDQFLGITGPLYLIGLIMLILGGLTVASVISKKWQNRIARIGLELPVTHIIIAAFNLFLLVLANSVYFHAKFGVNIMLKEFRFGMVFAFIGVGLMLIGGIFEYKKGGIKWENLKGEAKPLIDIEETRKHEIVREHSSVVRETPKDEIAETAETHTAMRTPENTNDDRYPNL
ncbi:hypothetical protein HZA39_04280 [Candidatus Peregrinibacteria bacterium]|nr:hypothetical protein [Candidatus Peregrinibacteria bacterium]